MGQGRVAQTVGELQHTSSYSREQLANVQRVAYLPSHQVRLLHHALLQGATTEIRHRPRFRNIPAHVATTVSRMGVLLDN
jgi:hypothetical protein